MELDILQKRAIFKALGSKSQLEVGKEFGFDKYFKNENTIRMKVNQVYREVRDEPGTFSIDQEVLEMVEKAMTQRKTVRTTKEKAELLVPEKVNEKDLVVGAHRKAWILLNKKLDHLAISPRAFAEESIMNLAKIAGIAFDKSQIVKGEATENISLRAQIDKNITPEEAVAQLMRFREATIQDDRTN